MQLNKKILNQSFSFIIPVYNEGKVLEKNTKRLYKYLKDVKFKKFEILLCDNASTDNTNIIAKNLAKKYSEIRYIFTNKEGFGSGVRVGIKSAKFTILILFPIDLAFHPKYISESIDALCSKNADVVIGSKWHHKSRINRPFFRRIASFSYNALVNIFFRIKIYDTQGAVTFKKTSIMPFLKNLSSNNSFLQTQLMIYSRLNDLKIIEIPVIVDDPRKSSFNLKSEIIKLFMQLIKEYFRIHSRK